MVSSNSADGGVVSVLICDYIGLKKDGDGQPDHSAVAAHITGRNAHFHMRGRKETPEDATGIHFYYMPHLSAKDEILHETRDGRYNAVIAAATFIPQDTLFPMGGVRIGTGTGNMASASWGGVNGDGGVAPLMNTPGFNSRATAHMVMKAMLRVAPDLPFEVLHQQVVAGDFDTGRNLRDYPTDTISGKKIAILGYGNIGREVAKLARAFGLSVAVYARGRHRRWIEAQGYEFAPTPEAAAKGADFVSIHVGLGKLNSETKAYSNAGMIGNAFLDAMNENSFLVNFDRGEVVDVSALDKALDSGRLRQAAIDADIFVDAGSGQVSGPLAPYLDLAARYPERLLLLPHAAADTDHTSRVEGARQAVDQVLDVVLRRSVTNLVGTLPPDFCNLGTRAGPGVGAVTTDRLRHLADDASALDELRALSGKMASFWQALGQGPAGNVSDADAIAAINRYIVLIRDLGLDQPMISS